ncbi:hypothetical protein [Rhodohalobacter halophilus]|uniref:hypothetical protein n=1 Tax=Rhodohalobacter halophilus TaxID=1812810 RepID=UPI00083F7D6C|nr:hypothetical protein [Rhodohalobacter halophilus]
MKTINQVDGFSKERFLQVVKRFWVLNQKKWLIGFAGGVGILILIYLLNSTQPTGYGNSGYAVLGVGLTLYKFGGYFLTSGIFNELGKKSSASQMLTLPASTLEKFLAGWFLTYFLYTIVVMGLLYLIGLFLEVNPILTTPPFSESTVDASDFYFLDTLLTYTALHSVFFLGSIYFDGNHFLKTLLAIVLFFIGLGIISVIFTILIANDFNFSYQFVHSPENMLFSVVFGKIAVAALFLFLSYRQLQNRQIA